MTPGIAASLLLHPRAWAGYGCLLVALVLDWLAGWK